MPRAPIGKDTDIRHTISADSAHVRHSADLAASVGGIAAVGRKPTESGAPESQPGEWELILVADGDAVSREWMRDTLEGEGYSVLVLASAVQFMELRVEYRAKTRLVICGANLDGHSAYELVHLMRDNLMHDVPIVVRVTDTVPPDAEAVKSRPDAVLTLPFSNIQLIATVDELLRRWADPVGGRAFGQATSARSPDPDVRRILPSRKVPQ